jgi:four helix bundle protein
MGQGRSGVQSYRDLGVWNEAMDLAVDCYNATSEFPAREVYGLTSQIRRASVSIPANIAEGYGRESPGHYVSFLRIAQGSLKELETHLMLSSRLGFVSEEQAAPVLSKADGIGRMLRSLIRSIQVSKE